VLGQLLEFAVHAPPSTATLESFESLGFQTLPVADAPGAPYAAFWDGTIVLGLHDAAIERPVPTFVRPDLKDHLRGLRHVGVEFEFTELADDEFHRAGFLDPNDRLVVLVEARTFPPVPRARSRVCACGEFVEWSIATHSLEESEAFWAALGLRRAAAGETPHRWVRLAGHGLVVGFHEIAAIPDGLTYRAADLDARLAYLQAKKIAVTRGARLAAPGAKAATLVLPGKTPLYLFDETA
jgi:hypothetical protein